MDELTQTQRTAYFRASGIEREDHVPREGASEAPHPSKGGSRGYPVWYRRRIRVMKEVGERIPKALLPSRSTVYRWKKRETPYAMTGNKKRRGMPGHHRFLLAVFKKVYPQASNGACAVYIACHSDDNRVFTDNEITRALKDMNMTRKKASTTAYQAFTPRNLQLHYVFWNHAFPSGIRGVLRKDMLDIDECALEVKTANISYGHAVRGLRVRKIGNYGRGKSKITVILAVEPGDPDKPPHEEGSTDNPRLWYRVSTDAGTSTESYVDFLNHYLMDYFDDNERRRTIMHDNLTSHKSDEVLDAIYRRGHQVICRVPYRPHEAPIEFVFDQLACEIRRRWPVIKDEKDLVREIHNVLDSRAGMGGFDQLFKDCGYLNEVEREGEEGDRTDKEEEDEEEEGE